MTDCGDTVSCAPPDPKCCTNGAKRYSANPETGAMQDASVNNKSSTKMVTSWSVESVAILKAMEMGVSTSIAMAILT